MWPTLACPGDIPEHWRRRPAGEIAANTAPVSVALARQLLWRMLGAAHPMEAHQADSRALFARG